METCKRRQLERRWRNFGFEVDKQQNDDQCSRKLLVLKSTKMSYNASLINNNKSDSSVLFNTTDRLLHRAPEKHYPTWLLC